MRSTVPAAVSHPENRKGVSRLTRMPLSPDEEVDAVVTNVTPFGVLVRTDVGLPGLVRGAKDPDWVASALARPGR